jgi:hypothetical protein
VLVVVFRRKGLMGDREIDLPRLFGRAQREREGGSADQHRPGQPQD